MSLVHSVKLFIFGGFLAVVAVALYALGYHGGIVVTPWLLGAAFCGAYFFVKQGPTRLLERKDFIMLAVLFVFFAFLYTLYVYQIPHQINTDEVTIMHFMNQWTADQYADIFALSPEYFYFPEMPFIVLGKLARVMGGVNLQNVRTLHALSGVLIVLASFCFLRIFFPSFYALWGAAIIGFNHSLLAISRMAMRDNLALLVEALAFYFLLRGFRDKSRFHSYVGGFVAGLGFYQYLPARITIILWGLFLLLVILFYRKTFSFRDFSTHAVSVALGFVIAVSPMAIATTRIPNLGVDYAREQILIYPEAQELERSWEGASTAYEAMYINMINGLTVLNAPIHDHGYIYPNYGYGFLDKLTGWLVWVGLFVLLWLAYKEREHLLLIGGFLFIMLFFAFLTTKNPSYTRFLLMLPFVGALATASFAYWERSRALILRIAGRTFFAAAVVAIAFLNLSIFRDFVDKGFREGNDVGGTARYADARTALFGYHYYIAADVNNMYYSWGSEWQWKTWLEFFTDEQTQTTEVVSPTLVASYAFERPFTVFMNRFVWEQNRDQLEARVSDYTLHNIKPDGSLVAIEAL